MRRYWFPKAYADVVARMRVPGGFVLAAAFIWLADPTPRSLAVGLPVALAGLLLRGWAAGHLAKNQWLASGGPYRHVRNPLYLGTLLAAAGLVIAARDAWLALLFMLVFGLVYLPVIELEEQHLLTLFPEYEEYAARVPWLWPRLRPWGTPQRARWKLYRENEEYQAALGLLAAATVLFWKAFR